MGIILDKIIEQGEIHDPKISSQKEGKICQYYGNFGSGKTYAATCDILRLLESGHTVYANWRIHVEDFDQRKSLKFLFFGILGKRKFYEFSHKNFHYIPFGEEFEKGFPNWTDCYVFIDEGHLFLNSYVGTKMDLNKIAAILHTRHFSRVLCIVSQRPTAVHTIFRSNVNVFYKCKKLISWPWPIFVKEEYQDMKDDTVDDESSPIRTDWYFASARVFRSYDSKYMRGDTPRSQPIYGNVYELSYIKRIMLFLNAITGKILTRLIAGLKPRNKRVIHIVDNIKKTI